MREILIIDDSIVARMLVKKVLKIFRPDWKIMEAGTGDEGINICSDKSQFDLILIDYNMPGINGLEAAKQIFPLQPKAIVILLTANIQNAIKAQAREINVLLIEKPITEEKIQNLISMVEQPKI